MHLSSMYGHLDNVKLLYSHGAYPFGLTSSGETPESYARHSGRTNVEEWLAGIE